MGKKIREAMLAVSLLAGSDELPGQAPKHRETVQGEREAGKKRETKINP